MICPRLPPDPKPEGIEGPSWAESVPAFPRDQATAKNSIFFIDTSFFCGVRSGDRGGRTPEGGTVGFSGCQKLGRKMARVKEPAVPWALIRRGDKKQFLLLMRQALLILVSFL